MTGSLKGHLLVATPRLRDPNFDRTVVLVLEHSDEGAAGVVLNRPSHAVVAAIREKRFYVLTHPDMKPAIGARVETILAGNNPEVASRLA